MARLADAGVSEIVVKMGASGCRVRSGADSLAIECEPVANVVDTTAAGDSFNAAYLAARIRGRDVADSARLAHRLAATVIQHRGAIIPVAGMPELFE